MAEVAEIGFIRAFIGHFSVGCASVAGRQSYCSRQGQPDPIVDASAISVVDVVALAVSAAECSKRLEFKELDQDKPSDQSCLSSFDTAGSHFASFIFHFFFTEDVGVTGSASLGACSDPGAATRSSITSKDCSSWL